MRLMCDTYLQRTVSMGSPGVDKLRWLAPVRPGDTLRLRMTVPSLDEVASWTLGFGPLAKVVSPAALARQVRDRLAAACGQYDAVAPPARRPARVQRPRTNRPKSGAD